VKHYHIKKNEKGQFYITEKHPFDSLAELVVFYKHEMNGSISDDDVIGVVVVA